MDKTLSLAKSKIVITLLEGIHHSAVDTLRDHGYTNVERIPGALGAEELRTRLRNTHIVGIRSRTKLTASVLQELDKLIAVGCFCIGVDQVALDTAARQGAPVFNAPHSNTRSVAELTIGLAIMLLRGIFPKSMAAHRSVWLKSAKHSFEARGKTLGIIGYGHIGTQVSVLAEAMGLRVIYHDVQTKLPLGNARQALQLDDVLREADIVSLHVPEHESTHNLMDSARINAMKPGSYLINASRGSVVDIEALAAALDTERIRGAAIDVFPTEPQSPEEAFESPLRGRDNVIITPHIGGSTMEAQESIGREVAAKLVNFSDRGSTETAVNFPNLALRAPAGEAHRILHIHANQPGILKNINAVVAHGNINVLRQHLETNREIGYVVLDIDPSVARQELQELRAELRSITGTIRTRVLY